MEKVTVSNVPGWEELLSGRQLGVVHDPGTGHSLWKPHSLLGEWEGRVLGRIPGSLLSSSLQPHRAFPKPLTLFLPLNSHPRPQTTDSENTVV